MTLSATSDEPSHDGFSRHENRNSSHLRAVIQHGRLLGEAAAPPWDAYDQIDADLDVILHAARPSHLGAWKFVRERAVDEYRKGAATALKRIAAEMIARHKRPWPAAHETALACRSFATDEEIAGAVGIKLGRPWCPIRLARLAPAGATPEPYDDEAVSVDEAEARDLAEMRASRCARDVFASLADEATLIDFAAALRHAQPVLDGDAAMRMARGVATCLAQPPQVQRGSGRGADPFAEIRQEPGEAEFARQRAALAMLKRERVRLAAALIAAADARRAYLEF